MAAQVDLGIMPDEWIREQAKEGMIVPFIPGQVKARTEIVCVDGEDRSEGGTIEKVISYGTSSYGYDMRVADEFKVFSNVHGNTIVDPKNFDSRCFHTFQGEHCIIPPNSFALCRSVERFKIPNDVLCIVLGKSTYARCGIVVNVTPLEPMWEGHVTIEISNTTTLPAKIYSNEGIAQVLFFKSGRKCQITYADRAGKYQDQGAEIVEAKV